MNFYKNYFNIYRFSLNISGFDKLIFKLEFCEKAPQYILS